MCSSPAAGDLEQINKFESIHSESGLASRGSTWGISASQSAHRPARVHTSQSQVQAQLRYLVAAPRATGGLRFEPSNEEAASQIRFSVPATCGTRKHVVAWPAAPSIRLSSSSSICPFVSSTLDQDPNSIFIFLYPHLKSSACQLRHDPKNVFFLSSLLFVYPPGPELSFYFPFLFLFRRSPIHLHLCSGDR